MVKDSKNLVVGLDIGTSKIVAIVAEVTPEGELNVIGMGTQPSRGLKKGVVVNIEATMASIQRVLEEAELMADCQIKAVYTGIAGSHIQLLHVARHGRDQGEGSHAGGHRPRRGNGEGHPHPQRPADPAHRPAELHDRRAGGRARAAGHERRSPRSRRAHRHRRGVRRRERHQVHPPLRTRSAGRRAAAARVGARRAVRGREGTRRVPDRHRRRHVGHRRLRRRRDTPHRGHSRSPATR